MTVIGNVLGSTANTGLGLPADLGTTSTGSGNPAAPSQVYTSADGSQLSIYHVDQATISWTSLWLHGNFDTVNQKVMWNASALTSGLRARTRAAP